MILDAHAHVGHGRFKSLEPEELLRRMDAAGVDRAVLCPVEEQIVIRNREGNEYIQAQVRRYPQRFVGFAVANPWYGEEAVTELNRALDQGAAGLKLHPVLQGFSINGLLAYPLVEVAVRRRVPVYVHTGTAHFGEPFKLVELARRYPEGTFIMGHSGWSDFWNDLPRCHQFAPNIFFETSRNGPGNYTHMLSNLGADFIIFGSNAPEALYEVEIATLESVLPSQEDRAKIFGLNLLRVLGGTPC